MTARQWISGLRTAGIVAASILLLLLVSPLILVIPEALFEVDWIKLSNIGQSYTGIAAILSAAALLGIVYSIRLQRRQNEITQGQVVRDMQFRLIGMFMDNSTYASIFTRGGDGPADLDLLRLNAYRTQWFRYLEYGYLVGGIPEKELRRIIQDLFANPQNRTWWTGESTDYWKVSSDKAFYRIVDEEFAIAASLGSASGT